MLNLTWGKKLFLFAVLIALVPLLISSINIIGIAKDELKSKNNDELISTAVNIAEDLNSTYANNWLSPLLMIKSGIENEDLGGPEKATLLVAAVENLKDICAITVYFKNDKGGFDNAIETRKQSYIDQLGASSSDTDFLSVHNEEIENLKKAANFLGKPEYFKLLDRWFVSLLLPLNLRSIPEGYLAVRIDITNLRDRIMNHPFSRTGNIYIIDSFGDDLCSRERSNISQKKVVRDAIDMLRTDTRIEGVSNYENEDGVKFVGGYALPQNLSWAVITEIEEGKAYLAVSKMLQTLVIWVLIGILIALLAVVLYSKLISRPILKISDIAKEVTRGNFDVHGEFNTEDSIGILGKTLIKMAVSLKKSFAKIERQRDEIEEYSKTLELKVEDRTKELNQTNKELNSANKVLTELNKEKNEFLSIAAHDLKNPISAIGNTSQLMLDYPNMEENQKEEFYRMILQSSANMTRIIKSILDVNAIEEGKLQLNIIRLNLSEIIILVINSNSVSAKSKNLTINFDIMESPVEIEGDKNAVTQILDNLMSNAIKFSPKGKNVSIELREKESSVLVAIKDEGPGLSTEDKSQLFKKYARLSARPTGGEQSTGLGLSIVKKIAERMNAQVDCYSEIGKGATFSVEFNKIFLLG